MPVANPNLHPEIASCEKCKGTGSFWEASSGSQKGREVPCVCRIKIAYKNYLGPLLTTEAAKQHLPVLDKLTDKTIVLRASWPKFRPFMKRFLIQNATLLQGTSEFQHDVKYHIIDLYSLTEACFNTDNEFNNLKNFDRFKLLVILIEFNFNNKFSPDLVRHITSYREANNLGTWIITPRIGETLRSSFAPDRNHPAYTNAERLREYLETKTTLNKDDALKWV